MLILRLISILYCAEGKGYSDDEIMQHECMLEFAYEKDQINGPLTRADGDHCKLFGVLCKKGMITQIDWMKEQDMVVDSLHWIPPTVEVFRVHKIFPAQEGWKRDTYLTAFKFFPQHRATSVERSTLKASLVSSSPWSSTTTKFQGPLA